jgi:hypothetical protein
MRAWSAGRRIAFRILWLKADRPNFERGDHIQQAVAIDIPQLDVWLAPLFTANQRILLACLAKGQRVEIEIPNCVERGSRQDGDLDRAATA